MKKEFNNFYFFMRTYYIVSFLFIVLISYASYVFLNKVKLDLINDQNIKQTAEYVRLEKTLKIWSEKYGVVTPSLTIRFNRSNEAFYRYNTINLLITKETFFNNKNIPYMEVMIAHEFGHHLSHSKIYDLDGVSEELYADLVALKLVGYKSIEKVFKKEQEGPKRIEPDPQLSFKNRLFLLKNSN